MEETTIKDIVRRGTWSTHADLVRHPSLFPNGQQTLKDAGFAEFNHRSDDYQIPDADVPDALRLVTNAHAAGMPGYAEYALHLILGHISTETALNTTLDWLPRAGPVSSGRG